MSPAGHPHKMKDICAATGLPRQAIHFYIQQGLLPPGEKTGRNMAYYSDAHIERVRLIRQLQEERFLPLKAIKALLDGRDEAFSDTQRRFLAEVSSKLRRDVERGWVEAGALMRAAKVTGTQLAEMAEEGVIAARKRAGKWQVASRDIWMLELAKEMRAAGLSDDLGFEPADLAHYARVVDDLIQWEIGKVASRFLGRSGAEAAEVIERGLPLIHQFITRYHQQRIHDLFAGTNGDVSHDESGAKT